MIMYAINNNLQSLHIGVSNFNLIVRTRVCLCICDLIKKALLIVTTKRRDSMNETLIKIEVV